MDGDKVMAGKQAGEVGKLWIVTNVVYHEKRLRLLPRIICKMFAYNKCYKTMNSNKLFVELNSYI